MSKTKAHSEKGTCSKNYETRANIVHIHVSWPEQRATSLTREIRLRAIQRSFGLETVKDIKTQLATVKIFKLRNNLSITLFIYGVISLKSGLLKSRER